MSGGGGNEKVIPVKVALRIRPLVPKEKAEACVECLRTVPGEPQVILGKDKAFTYDYVFAPVSPQIEVYESSVQPLLNSLFKGYNATVLAYGQTGSGKTYSMGSGYLSLYNALHNENISAFNINDLDDVGIIPRVLTDLFTRIEEEQRQNGTKFFITVSFVEVYNEEIKDLFNSKLNAEPLNIREENSSIRVVNLSEIEVSDAITTLRLLEKGSSLRVVGGTAMNDQSSRSHAIFTINMEQRPADSGSDCSEATITRSKFHLVDLAGSERQSKTKAEGLRLKEGININLGLLALGNVISILGEDNPKHVPYRESKLTRLLQDSLGGNSHTVMIACVSPADSNLEETLNTLRYADRARKIKNKPVVNIDPQTAEVMRLRQENQELKSKLIQATGGAGLTNVDYADSSKEIYLLKEEVERVKAENSKLVREIQFATQNNLRYYEKLEKALEEKEQFKKRYEEIKQMFEKLVKKSQETVNLEISNSSNSNPGDATSLTLNQTYSEKQNLINELQTKLNEFDELKVKEEKAIAAEPEPETELISPNEPVDKEYVMRQARMQFQLTEYDAELAKKEMLFQKMRENNYEDQLLRSSHNMQDLRSKIDSLEKEKEDLMDALRSNEATSRKAADLKRDRLKQLELEVLDLKRKEKEYARMVKLKEENEKHCERLRAEIVHIKQERVKLLKQIRSDADAFRKFRQEKEKEVTTLKALDRKRQVEIHKLQEGNTKQDAVLRRKNEEISRMQKQVREMVEKQKQVAEKRLQAFERKDSSLLGDKLRGWITQELDLSVNIAETRILLTQLIEERKEANSELTRLNKERNDLIELNNNIAKQSNNKRKLVDMDCTYVAGGPAAPSNDDQEEVERNNAIADLDSRILRLEEEIECKSIQITEIQQTVIDGDQEEKTKHIFNSVHGLMEAKVLLKHLYYTGVTAMLENKQVKAQNESTISSLSNELKELKKKYEQMDEEFKTTKRSLKKEISDLTLYYEQRVLVEIKQVLENMSYTQDDRVNRLYEQILATEKRLDDELSTLASEGTFGGLSTLNGPRTSGLKKTFLLNSENRLNNEFKKAAKINREHRRTRVLPQHHRAKIVLPEIDVNLVDITNSAETPNIASSSRLSSSRSNLSTTTEIRPRAQSPMDVTICKPSVSFLSPMASGNGSALLSDIEATPDDTNKDPDWTKTPIHFKRPKRTSVRIQRL